MLTCSIIGGAFIGVTSNLLATENEMLRLLWSYELRTLICLPLAIVEGCTASEYSAKMHKFTEWRIAVLTFMTVIFELVWNYGLIYGCNNLIQSHAYVCNTLFCIFIVMLGYCACIRPYSLELIGLIVTIGGVAVMLSDTSAQRTDGKTGTFIVYMICISCAFLASFFFLINDLLIKKVPVFSLIVI